MKEIAGGSKNSRTLIHPVVAVTSLLDVIGTLLTLARQLIDYWELIAGESRP